MRRLGTKLAHAFVIIGVLCGLSASPALADHDHHNKWRKHDHHEYRHRDWDRQHTGYYRSYDRHYYYEPHVRYYAPPPVYVPPPPTSFGLNLVFPIH